MTEGTMELGDVGTSLMASDSKKAPVKPPNKFERLVQPCLAELVGTMFFVFIGCVSVIENVEAAGRLQPALVHGLAVAVMVACMAEISGSHFNPPFTIAIYLCGGMKLNMVGPYLISQLIGGVLGASMSKLMTTTENYSKAQGAAFALLQSQDQLWGALFGEIAMTCLVTMVVLLGAVNAKSSSPMVPFMVGCTVIINILAGGDVSGTCLNPARALGPAIVANYWTYHWVYWVGPITGGLVAAALVRLLLGDRKTRILMK
ncbi:aquaporin-8 isoform X1 [Salmo salar]|uniref:Aquaporin 8b n=3 Tax=Salmoninae TaxID=504568 RepID=C0HB60_SALSA|nr:aquaporin-8 [Salmo salar]XP_029627363.1 aquaporin-8-like [Salmo trutta]XP_045575455.1 aquaporin-8 isoform X1 [Salmo salar]ACN11279.1 Aquaporin-8 [Salmo salar]AGS07440.1 aquaporin 8b [Salmo salar]|eukprot:NP_001167386.1 aquaporin-8 [Salmo salar]